VQETNGTFLVGGVAAVVGSVQAGGYFTVCDETFDLFGFPVGGGGVEARGSAADFEFFFGKIEAAFLKLCLICFEVVLISELVS